MSHPPRLSVYLSSTYVDLAAHRQPLLQALRTAGYEVDSMESYAASDERPAAKCVADVAEADAYVGVIARRYGYVPAQDNPEQLSITEMEYRAAGQAGKPRLLFLLDPQAPWPAQHDDRHGPDAGRRIEDLRARLGRDHVTAFFRSPEELTLQVLQALSHLPRPSAAPHWLWRWFWHAARALGVLLLITLGLLEFFKAALPELAASAPGQLQARALIWGLLVTLIVEGLLWARRRRRNRRQAPD